MTHDLLPPDLDAIAAVVAQCTRCDLCRSRTRAVFGEGPAGARVMFVGEGPGAVEDETGRPFVGPAGELLDRIIAAMGLERRDCYITNVVKCRPPENATPTPDQALACDPYLRRQIELVKPAFLVALGAVAGQVLTGRAESVIRLRGRVLRCGDIPLVVTYHPAALLRDPSKKKAVWEDMKLVMARL
jgi:DNA polymerase